MISSERINQLYIKYRELVELEVKEFGVKPTEVRHLLGRLGEFYCALKLDGTLAHEANQHGFDVIDKSNRKVSVKTTAQKTGFVPINISTVNKVDDIMIIQYIENELHIVYYGPIQQAIEAARYYPKNGKYELDISKAKKIA